MLSEQLLQELQQLDKVEKLRVVQMLVNQLASEASKFQELNDAGQFEIWSPYDSFGAAATLQAMLDEHRRENGES